MVRDGGCRKRLKEKKRFIERRVKRRRNRNSDLREEEEEWKSVSLEIIEMLSFEAKVKCIIINRGI